MTIKNIHLIAIVLSGFHAIFFENDIVFRVVTMFLLTMHWIYFIILRKAFYTKTASDALLERSAAIYLDTNIRQKLNFLICLITLIFSFFYSSKMISLIWVAIFYLEDKNSLYTAELYLAREGL